MQFGLQFTEVRTGSSQYTHAFGMVVDNKGLASGGEGGELIQVGVLGRLGAVRGDAVRAEPDAVVGIGEDKITAGGRCQGALRPRTPPLLAGGPRGGREVSEVEQIIEEARPGIEHSGVGQRGRASLPGGDDASEPLVKVRVKLPQAGRGPMARVEISHVLAIGVVGLITGPVPDDPQPRGR